MPDNVCAEDYPRSPELALMEIPTYSDRGVLLKTTESTLVRRGRLGLRGRSELDTNLCFATILIQSSYTVALM